MPRRKNPGTGSPDKEGEDGGVAPRPRGPENVVAAVVDAATRLFAERGPHAVSLRDIAREAGVNYGLIHYYFGTKVDVQRAVFSASSYRVADRLTEAGDVQSMLDQFWQASPGADSYVRMLVWFLLEGQDMGEILGRSPTVVRLTGAIQHAYDEVQVEGPRFDARLVAATTVMLTMAWRLFSPFLIPAAGMEDRSPVELRAELGELAKLLIAASAAARRLA